MPTRLLAAVVLTLFVAACDDDPPTTPSGQSRMTFGAIAPASGGTVTTTGFQVFRLPCSVTAVHAYLHTRNSGLLIPPTASETAADGSATLNFTIR